MATKSDGYSCDISVLDVPKRFVDSLRTPEQESSPKGGVGGTAGGERYPSVLVPRFRGCEEIVEVGGADYWDPTSVPPAYLPEYRRFTILGFGVAPFNHTLGGSVVGMVVRLFGRPIVLGRLDNGVRRGGARSNYYLVRRGGR